MQFQKRAWRQTGLPTAQAARRVRKAAAAICTGLFYKTTKQSQRAKISLEQVVMCEARFTHTFTDKFTDPCACRGGQPRAACHPSERRSEGAMKIEQARRPQEVIHEVMSMIAGAPAHSEFPRISLLFPCYFSRNSRFYGAFSRCAPVIFPVKTGTGAKKQR